MEYEFSTASSFSACIQESLLASVFPTPALTLAPPPLAGVTTSKVRLHGFLIPLSFAVFLLQLTCSFFDRARDERHGGGVRDHDEKGVSEVRRFRADVSFYLK